MTTKTNMIRDATDVFEYLVLHVSIIKDDNYETNITKYLHDLNNILILLSDAELQRLYLGN